MLETSSPLSESHLDKIADKINVEVVSKKSKNAKSKNLTYVWNLRATGKLTFLIPGTKKAFNQLKLVFTLNSNSLIL